MKKKFTMLFAALLACVGVMAQAYDGVYTIGVDANIQRGYVAAGVGYAEYPVLSGITLNGYTQNDTESIENGQNWYITSVNEGTTYYIYNVALGKFLVGGDVINFGDTPYAWSFSANGDFVNIKDVTVGKFLSGGCGRPAASRPIAYDTNSNDGGAKHTITAVDGGETTFAAQIAAADAVIQELLSKTITVTYKYLYGNQVLGTEEGVEVVKGEAFTATTAPYGVVFEYPETVSEDLNEGDVVEIPCKSTLPFAFAADYASIEHWYYLNISGNARYLYHDANLEYIDLSKTSVDGANKDAYTWAFIGNPFDGFQLVNKAAGEGMILSSSENTYDGNTGGNTYPVMTTKPVPEGNNTYWVPSAGTGRDNGFYLEQKGKSANKMNNRDNKLAYWNSGADAGSTFVVTERGVEFTYLFTYEGEEVATQNCQVLPGNDYPTVGVVLPYHLVATVPAGVVTAAIEGTTIEIELVNEKALPFETAADANSITTWYYVKMHTNQPGYLGDIADDNTINVAWNKSSDVYSDNYVWGFVGNVFDGITVVNKGTGLQLTSTGDGNVTLTENGTPLFVFPTSETSANATNGFCLRRSDSNQYLNANYGASKLSHWSSTDAGSTFFLTEYEEAEVSVSDVDWATMYLGYAVYIPEGVNAYTVTGVEGGYVTLTQLEGVIPANTGVLLENAGEYTFKKAAKDPAAVAENLLRGSVANTYVEGTAYVLSAKNGVGLYKATLNKNAEGGEGDTHFLNNAGKAYLVLPTESEAPAMFSLGRGEGTTAIDNVQLTNDNVVIYDLAGRRVEKMEKGIYIVNGKKVVK